MCTPTPTTLHPVASQLSHGLCRRKPDTPAHTAKPSGGNGGKSQGGRWHQRLCLLGDITTVWLANEGGTVLMASVHISPDPGCLLS